MRQLAKTIPLKSLWPSREEFFCWRGQVLHPLVKRVKSRSRLQRKQIEVSKRKGMEEIQWERRSARFGQRKIPEGAASVVTIMYLDKFGSLTAGILLKSRGFLRCYYELATIMLRSYLGRDHGLHHT
jgi:hypothetical protein